MLVAAAWTPVWREKESGWEKSRKDLLAVKSHVQAHHLSSPPYGTLVHMWGYRSRQEVRGHRTLTTLLHIQSRFGYLCTLLHPAASLDTASAYVPPLRQGHSHTKSDICLFNEVKAFGQNAQPAWLLCYLSKRHKWKVSFKVKVFPLPRYYFLRFMI